MSVDLSIWALRHELHFVLEVLMFIANEISAPDNTATPRRDEDID